MRKIHYIIIVLLASIGFASCEFKHENNGDLGGMWQLTQWHTRSSSGQIDSLVASNLKDDSRVPNTRKLYFSFYRNVFQVRDASTYFGMNYYSTFTRNNNEITLGNLIDYEGHLYVDETQTDHNYKEFSDFGIPENGKFHIDLLNGDNLQLSYNGNILSFRKY